MTNFYLSNSILYHIRSGQQTDFGFLKLFYIQNTGAAFSILQDSTILLIILSILALLLICYYLLIHIKNLPMVMLFWGALLASGISCNLYERIHFGFVRDFFELTFVEFPVFNISDIFINLSVIAILIIIFNKNYLKKS